MIGTILFFITSLFVGKAIFKLLKIDTGDLTLISAWITGIVATTLVLFGLGVAGFFTIGAIWAGLVVLLVISLTYLKDLRILKKDVTSYLRENVRHELPLRFFLAILFIWFFGRALLVGSQGELIAGDRLVWVDWPIHLTIASSFAWGSASWRIPPQNATFAGIPLVYPFFADFLSGVFLKLGANYPWAFAAPSIVLILLFVALYLGLARSFFEGIRGVRGMRGNRIFAFLSLVICLFWGGMGFVHWFGDISEQGFSAFFFPPREYTFWQEKGYWFFTFLYSEILPQRAFLFGLPIFFLILLLVKHAWEKRDKRGKGELVLAGVLGGVLPFFHTHSFLSLWFLTVSFMGLISLKILKSPKLLRDKKAFILASYFFIPLIVLSLIQLPQFMGGSRHIPFVFGWMKGKENFVLFWFKNTGFFLPLMLLGLWKGSAIENSSAKKDTRVRLVGIASISLFIIPNLFQFSAWGYDNLKIFTYWYLLGAPFVIAGLYGIWQIRRIRSISQIGATLLFLTLIISGVLEIIRVVQTPRVQIQLWSKSDQQFAEHVREKTDPTNVFLTAAIHDHPVSSLAGRKIVIGFPGNSWSWGIAGWDIREKDVHTMFQGGNQALELWKKYGIDYIVVSDRERYFEPRLNEEFIRENSQLLIEQGKMKVYQIN